MVFLQGAARKESPAGVCLELAMRGFIDLCISQEILDEVESVLSRPLDLALHAAANYLVTRDADLLDVPTGTDAESLAIRSAAPDLQIVDPVAFLTLIRRDTLFK